MHSGPQARVLILLRKHAIDMGDLARTKRARYGEGPQPLWANHPGDPAAKALRVDGTRRDAARSALGDATLPQSLGHLNLGDRSLSHDRRGIAIYRTDSSGHHQE